MTLGRRLAVVVFAALCLLVAGCGSDAEGPSATTASNGSGSGLTGSITVAAASSLTEVFTALGDEFRSAQPGIEVTFTFNASSTMAAQILEGAPVDVFAPADAVNMEKLTDEGLVVDEPVAFASNELVIVTKPANPADIVGLHDLATAGVISLCGADAPCGKFAQQALDGAGTVLDESNVTRGQNAKATLGAVAQGDAVAGIVYVTDARAAGDSVEAIAIPDDQQVVVTYSIAVMAGTSNVDAAEAWVAFMGSEAGQAILASFGFLPPA